MSAHPDRTPLIGRGAELERLRRLLRTRSPITIVGVGGVGKTRLAAAVVAEGTWPSASVCELAGLRDPGQVAHAVADALGFRSLDAAAVGLAGTRCLVVLDNCEHVIDAAAEVVTRLSAECPEITVLATSREPLDVPGEHVLRLSPLTLPGADDRAAVEGSAAGRLFLDRAQAAGAPEPDDTAWPAIAQLCRCLDGLPLGIELAAAKTRSLTPAEILSHLGDRLDVIARRRDRGPDRHRSLAAAIEWSYARLPDHLQRLFERLGVFTSPFTVAAAAAVLAGPGQDQVDVAGDLDQLVAQSLVTVEHRGGRSWYGMLDTLRTFARARLVERGDYEVVADRWVDSLVATANQLVRTGMRAGTLDAWLTVHTVEGDLFAALRRTLDADRGPERAVRLFAPLWWIAYHARAEPVAELGDRLLRRWPDSDQPGWSDVAAITAFAHVVLGDLDGGEQLAHQVLESPYSMAAGVIANRALAVHAHVSGRDEDALRWAEAAIADAELGDLRAWRHEVEALRAFLLGGLGRVDEAIDQALAAREGAAALGSPTLLAWTSLAHACLVAVRDPAAGRAALRPLAERCEAVGDELGAGRSLRALGAIAALEGDRAEAVPALRRALVMVARTGHAAQVRATLRWVAFLAEQAGHAGISAQLH
ncbi:MAG TPA: hypothetical protein VIK95_10170, partial [Egibacteraceae bacterium]